MEQHEYLAHHGIKGQRKGFRRFQDYAGRLTAAGRERYGVGVARARSIANVAKKAGRFGAALSVAKAEHYAKTASRGLYDASRKAKRLSNSVGKVLNTQRSVANQLRNTVGQTAYKTKRLKTLRNITQQANYKRRYNAGKSYIDSMREIKLASFYGSDYRVSQRSEIGKTFVFMRARKARDVLAAGPPSRTTLSSRGKRIAASRAVDYIDDEYRKTIEGWQNSVNRYRKSAKSSWSTARGA